MRDLLAAQPLGDEPAARTPPPARPDDVPARAWLPGADFERHVPRHAPGGGFDPAEGWRGRLRWDPGRRGAAALGGLLVAAVAATGWWLAASRPHQVPISGPSGSPAPAGSVTISSSPVSAMSTSLAAPSASGGALVVDVAGKVRQPGIYRLPPGARVYDAVRAAGGARPGVSTVSLNLAEPLHDGEQIVVGLGGGAGVAASGVAAGGVSGGASHAPTAVALNTATLEQLETLPGVGPVLGQHILDWRDAHGRFSSVDQLREVSGIGDVRFAQLRPLVSL